MTNAGLTSIAVRLVRLEGGCEQSHRTGTWHMHEERVHAIGRELASFARAEASAAPDREALIAIADELDVVAERHVADQIIVASLGVDARFLRRLAALPASTPSPSAGQDREALIDNVRRSVKGRCINPACPSQHADYADDCVDAALDALTASLPASTPDREALIAIADELDVVAERHVADQIIVASLGVDARFLRRLAALPASTPAPLDTERLVAALLAADMRMQSELEAEGLLPEELRFDNSGDVKGRREYAEAIAAEYARSKQ